MSPHFCSPDMIASHFLHAYIVVQPIDPCTSITRYRVSVVAQRDVPPFGPPLPAHSAIFDKGLAFKDFLLAKLINGERACYQATKFQALHQRTRATLLVNLAKELREQTIEYINSNYQSSLMLHMTTASLKEASKSPSPSSSGRLFTSVKRALKHVGSTKHEFQRHASAGSLSEVVNLESASVTNSDTAVHPPGTTSATRKNTTSSTGSTEDQSVKADSGHGDSDNSFPSSPQLSQCRKKLSTSQPHLSTLSDHLPVGSHVGSHAHPHSNNSSTVMDTSSVEADDIIYEPRNRPRMIQRRPALQLPKGSGPSPAIDPDCHTVISGAVTTIPVGGSPTSTTSSSGGSAGGSSTASSSTSSNSASASNSVTRLHQDISRLRVDKLELLRQALSAQHEVRQLRQREAQLETDLALAAAEIRRLKSQLKKENNIAVPTNSTNNGDVTSKVVGVASPKQSSTTVVRPPARSARKTVHMQIPL